MAFLKIYSILFTISVIYVVAGIYANIRHKSYKNNPNIEKAKGVYIVFSVLLFIIYKAIFSFNHDSFTKNNVGLISKSFEVRFLIYICILIFILISLIIKATSKKKIIVSLLITISIILPIITYQINYYLLILKELF